MSKNINSGNYTEQKKKKKPVSKKLIIIYTLIIAAVIFVAYAFIEQAIVNNQKAEKVSNEEMEVIIEDALKTLPKKQAVGAMYILENISVNVKNISYNNGREMVVDCDVITVDVENFIKDNIDSLLSEAKKFNDNWYAEKKRYPASPQIRQMMEEEFSEQIKSAEILTNENVRIYVYEMEKDKYSVHFSDDMINNFFGNYKFVATYIDELKTFNYDGKEESVDKLTNCRNTIKELIVLNNYEKSKPDTSTDIMKWFNSIGMEFERNFLEKGKDGTPRYMYLVKGLGNTIFVTLISLFIGIAIGFIVAIIRVTNATTGKLEIASWICQIYLSVMRGTPLMIQLLIIYFVILLPSGVGSVPSAIVCFGLNSGAYVSEIVRGGIMSVDKGQTEAGRSIGFTYVQTMWHIVLPQAFKAVLPSLANEFITLLKETSVAFYIGVADLTLGGNKIRSQTYSNFMPLIAVAVVYLILVLGLSKLVSILERRLRKGDNR